MTGQTAGIAIILVHLFQISFGQAFFLVNLPFYFIGLFKVGLAFVACTFLCVTMLSVLVDVLPHYVTFEQLHPLVATKALCSQRMPALTTD